MFSYLLETSILNAYHLWKFAQKHWSYITFKLELAEQLIGNYRKRANRGRRRTLDHTPEHNDKAQQTVRCKKRAQYRHEMRIRADSATAGRYTIMSLLGVVKLSVFFVSFSFFSLFVSGEHDCSLGTNAPVFVFQFDFQFV